MEWWRVGLALGLPWLAGALWVRGVWRDAPAGVWPLALGYGYMLGMLAVTLLLRLPAAAGLPLDFIGPAVVLALVALAGGGWLRRRTSFPFPLSMNGGGAPKAEVMWPQILFVLLLGWLGWVPAVAMDELWALPLCATFIWVPALYVRWRERAHAAHRLRCDWLR